MNGLGNTNDWLTVVRAIHFAATATIAGVLIFRVAVAEPALRLARPAASAFDAQARHVAWISLVVSAGSGVAWLLLQVPAMSGLSFGEAMTVDMIGTVITETQFGLIWEIRAALAIALAASLASDRLPGARWLALASAIGLVAVIAWTGHAGSTAGELGVLHVAADILHLVAAATWIGGLTCLILLFVMTLRHQTDGWVWPLQDATQRFSRLGILSVSALLATGIVNSSILVGSLHALLVTAYGRLLMLKIALFIIMLGFAAVNRFWLTPRLAERGQNAVRTLARNSIIELALGLAIFAIVGALGTMHPASHLV